MKVEVSMQVQNPKVAIGSLSVGDTFEVPPQYPSPGDIAIVCDQSLKLSPSSMAKSLASVRAFWPVNCDHQLRL